MTAYHIDPVIVEAVPKHGHPRFEVAWPENGNPHVLIDGAAVMNPTMLRESDNPEPADRSRLTAIEIAEKFGMLIFKLAEEINTLKLTIEELPTDAEYEAEKALRVAAEQAQIQAEKREAYWYRRCAFAEAALQPLADRHEARVTLEARTHCKVAPMGHDEERLREELQHAHRTLAEFRKGDLPNYEDVIRDRRQKNFLAWAVRTFSKPAVGNFGEDGYTPAVDANDPAERLFRFLEEAIEFVQVGCDQIAATEEAMADAVFESEAEVEPYSVKAQMDRFWNRLLRTANRVWAKPPGKVPQEIGGAAVTLMAAAERFGVKVAAAERDEFARVLSIPKEEFQKRHQKKVDDGY